MASTAATAGIRDMALKRLSVAAQALAAVTGVPAPEMPQYRDPAYQGAMQLDVLATWTEQLVARIAPPGEEAETEQEFDPDELGTSEGGFMDEGNAHTWDMGDGVPSVGSVDYEALTVAELRALAEERQIDLSGLRLKNEIIDALEAADGKTETQQAADDGVDVEIDQE